MFELTGDDLHNVIRSLPKVVRDAIVTHNAILAGGYIREIVAGRCPSDIDLFVGPITGNVDMTLTSVDPAQSLADFIVETLRAKDERFPDNPPRKVVRFETKNAITILTRSMLPIQIITRWRFTDCRLVVDSFDFTVCRAAVYFDREQQCIRSIVDPAFYSDLAGNRLRYVAPERIEEAGGSIIRMKKFMSRGYKVDLLSIAKLMARVYSGFDKDALHDRLFGDRGFGGVEGGEEGWYTQLILGLLREVDPSISFSSLGIETSEDELIRTERESLNE